MISCFVYLINFSGGKKWGGEEGTFDKLLIGNGVYFDGNIFSFRLSR